MLISPDLVSFPLIENYFLLFQSMKKKKEEAKHHVAELTDEKIRQSIENMIENEDSYIIDTILKYVRWI